MTKTLKLIASNPQATSEADKCAEEFVKRHHERFRYDHGHQKWHEWNGSIWKPDETANAFHQGKLICRDMFPGKVTAAFVGGMLTIAGVHPAIAVASDFWDRDPFLLGTPDGTVDLRTGKLRAAMPSDYISKTTAVPPAPEADCPLWLKFLDEALQGDKETICTLQQLAGICLTGDISEEIIVFLWGKGGNGKGVFISTLLKILCDYGRTAAMETFMKGHNGFTSTLSFDIAPLVGARLVTAAETREDGEWDEGKLKWLTGGDEVTARFVRQNFFSFVPQFTPIISGNFKPVIRNVTEAMRRRLIVIGFPLQLPREKKDLKLKRKLEAEHPGILRWMVDGCLDWQANGLIRSPAILKATDGYFDEQDTVGRWLKECCEQHPRYAETYTSLLRSWHRWLEDNDEESTISDRGLIKRLQVDVEGCGKIRDRSYHGTSIRGWGLTGLRIKG